MPLGDISGATQVEVEGMLDDISMGVLCSRIAMRVSRGYVT